MEKETIESFLHRLNLDDSIEAFEEQDLDLDLLQRMSEGDLTWILKEMKLTLGKQTKIFLEIKDMKSSKFFSCLIVCEN